MPKKIIETKNAPQAIGPYSQAVCSGNILFTAGIIPLDPVTNQLSGGDIKSQTEKILENLSEILKSAGYKPEDVIKTTVFMTNLADFADMNEVYANFFKDRPPARTTVQVCALPKNVLVEMEAVAKK
jgi:2-iminobutanoate/2-iminopropanoate deaminase